MSGCKINNGININKLKKEKYNFTNIAHILIVCC